MKQKFTLLIEIDINVNNYQIAILTVVCISTFIIYCLILKRPNSEDNISTCSEVVIIPLQ